MKRPVSAACRCLPLYGQFFTRLWWVVSFLLPSVWDDDLLYYWNNLYLLFWMALTIILCCTYHYSLWRWGFFILFMYKTFSDYIYLYLTRSTILLCSTTLYIDFEGRILSSNFKAQFWYLCTTYWDCLLDFSCMGYQSIVSFFNAVM